jgi:predicted nucleic acid-binding Zn ribbon protein
MPAHRLSTWLANSTLGPLCHASRHTRELQRIFSDSAPRPLAQATRVRMLKDGTLYLSAENAAIAAKLRQLAPRLLITIRERVPEVTVIRVEAQVATGGSALSSHPKKKPLTIETIGNFEKAAAAMPESGLRSALAALARRHRRQS